MKQLDLRSASSVMTSDAWSRDWKHYQYWPVPVDGADCQLFRIVDELFATNENREYFGAFESKE